VVPSLFVGYASPEHHQEAGSDYDIPLNTALDISDSDFAGLGGNYFDPDLDLADFLTPQTKGDNVHYHSSESSSLTFHPIPSTGQTDHVQPAIRFPDVSIQATITIHSRIIQPAPETEDRFAKNGQSYPPHPEMLPP
jgi:hypothetical protein